MDIAEKMKEFLLRNVISGADDIGYDESLINSGLVDSFGILELVFFIEKTFGTKIKDFEIIDANADTVNLIAGLIRSRREGC